MFDDILGEDKHKNVDKSDEISDNEYMEYYMPCNKHDENCPHNCGECEKLCEHAW